MLSFKGNLLQFCLTDRNNKQEIRYTFGLCNRDIVEFNDTVEMYLKDNGYHMGRDFHRFNIVQSNEELDITVIPSRYRQVYNNRPTSELYRYSDEGDDEE
jgi:hypothetical protein